MKSRLALGTAQFGFRYGIANRSGQISRDAVAEILNESWGMGLDTLDTAIVYGEGEKVLGEIGVREWRVITKLPAIPDDCTDVSGWVIASVRGSLNRLKLTRLGGLLLHSPGQLLSEHGDALHKTLIALKSDGVIEKLGVSIYAPEELAALQPRFQFDLVQAPFNVIDRRLYSSGWLTRLHRAGIEIHVRSVFLQGLLLMDSALRPPQFRRWQSLWDRWHQWLAAQNLTAVQGCLGFAMSQSEISRVVVGVDSLSHLREILTSTEHRRVMAPEALVSDDLDLINPSRWKTL